NKIEKYENCDKKELNADQISAIKKKPEVSALIKEFEDLHKQYTVFDEQEQKEQENSKKLQDERLLREVNEKVEDVKASYALNVVINTRKFTFSNAELNALNYVREIILEKLYEASPDECCENVTFKDVNNLINLIINPPQVNKKDNCQNISFFSNDATIDYNEQQLQPHQQIAFISNINEEMPNDMINDVSISMAKINFMQPNELIGKFSIGNELKYNNQ
ncbi:hypothetical protein PIROE2DRAFT_2485, partial [Piromyces sp. E2]